MFSIYSPYLGKTLKEIVSTFFSRWKELLVMAMVGGLCLLPQLAYWRYSFGGWVTNSYGAQGEGFNFLHPQILNVLFSPEGGFLFWAPLLSLAIFGWLFMKQGRDWKIGVLICTLLQLWLVASWHMWTFGGSFGHRAFVETYALWAFPLAGALGWIFRKRWGWMVLLFCLVSLAWNLFMMKLYCTREISFYGLDWQALFDIFWTRKEWLLGRI